MKTSRSQDHGTKLDESSFAGGFEGKGADRGGERKREEAARKVTNLKRESNIRDERLQDWKVMFVHRSVG